MVSIMLGIYKKKTTLGFRLSLALVGLAKVGLAPLLPRVPLPLVDIVHLAHVTQQGPVCERVADHPALHALGAQKVVDKEKVARRKETATDRARDDLLPGVVVQVYTIRGWK